MALGSLPIVLATEIGFVVAFGVLLDTFLVRSVLVSALNLGARHLTPVTRGPAGRRPSPAPQPAHPWLSWAGRWR